MIRVNLGDNLQTLKQMEANSVDSVVTDPPYGLSFMNKRWDHDVPSVELWREVLRVLKPGGHMLAFGGTRTYHRLVVNIEDAGFEIRDQLQWLFGSGFPKSHDISKAIDKEAGANREVVGTKLGQPGYSLAKGRASTVNFGPQSGDPERECQITAPATEDAKKWQGFGTALKPANEPICLARKPLSESTVAKNVLKWGCGGIAIDNCRITDTKGKTLDRVLKSIECAEHIFDDSNACNDYKNDEEGAARKLHSQLSAFLDDLFQSPNDALCAESWSLPQGFRADCLACCRLYDGLLHFFEVADLRPPQQQLYVRKRNQISKLLGAHASKSLCSHEQYNRHVCSSDSSLLNAGQDAPRPEFGSGTYDALKCLKSLLDCSHIGEQETLNRLVLNDNFQQSVARFLRQIALETDKLDDDLPLTDPLFNAVAILHCITKATTAIKEKSSVEHDKRIGRWPSNLLFDEEAAEVLDLQSGYSVSRPHKNKTSGKSGAFNASDGESWSPHNDSGGASRFFYVAKASKSERNAGLENHSPKTVTDGRDVPCDNPFQRGETLRQNTHPTVKPVKLMGYLCRLITPPGGTILDPFMGSGSTGIAALKEGFGFIGCEISPEYVEIADARLSCKASKVKPKSLALQNSYEEQSKR